MTNKYRNFWGKDLIVPKPDFYENDAPEVLKYKDFTVYKTQKNGFDFVFKGVCVTQRAGGDKAKQVIDGILAQTEPVSDCVVDYFKKIGISFKRY